MNFAVFRCFWSHERGAAPIPAEAIESYRGSEDVHLLAENDLALQEKGVRFEHGRHALQGSNGNSHHWAGDGAAIAVSSNNAWLRKPNGSNQALPTAGKLPHWSGLAMVPAEQDIAPAEMGLRFDNGWSAPEHENGESYRWVENGARFTIQEISDTPVKTLSLDLERGPGLAKHRLELQVRDADGRIVARETIAGRQVAHFMLRVRPGQAERFQFHVSAGDLQGPGEPGGPALRIFRCRWSKPGTTVPEDEIISPLPLHTCACGDFTLLAREDWFELLGYPEFEMFSLHIDSVFCYMAHHHGVIEEMLEEPMRIYHIEHGTGSGWTPEGATKLMERIAAKGISCLECQEVLAWATEMRRLDRPLVLNYEGWGMADDVLPEQRIEDRG